MILLGDTQCVTRKTPLNEMMQDQVRLYIVFGCCCYFFRIAHPPTSELCALQ